MNSKEKMTDEEIAAKIYHILYPQSNFYSVKNDYRQWVELVKELKKQGIIKNDQTIRHLRDAKDDQ